MSYYASSYKPQVRVEGFHLPDHQQRQSEGGMDDLFVAQGFPGLPTDSFTRKYPSNLDHHGQHGGHHPAVNDFEEDLVSMMAQDRTTPSAHAQHPGGGSSFDDYAVHHHRPTTHNIFDVSSPIPTSTAANGPGSQPGSLHSPTPGSVLHDSYHHHQHQQQQQQHHGPPHHHQHQSNASANGPTPTSTNFNSTLPALNSSMRFENPENPPPGPPLPALAPLTPSSPHPPSSNPNPNGSILQRHTPSPTIHAPGVSALINVPGGARARSRSRPPSQGQGGSSLPAAASALSQLSGGGVGPARTARQRARGNSISGTSPPPVGARPHAIVIPGRNGNNGATGGQPMSAGGQPGSAGGGGGGHWFMGAGSSASEFSLPTPESLTSHQSFSHHSGFTPFSLSPPPGSSLSLSSSATATSTSLQSPPLPASSASNPAAAINGGGVADGQLHHLPPLHALSVGGMGKGPGSPMVESHPHHHHQQHQYGMDGWGAGGGMFGSSPAAMGHHPQPQHHGHHHHHSHSHSMSSLNGSLPPSTPTATAAASLNGSSGAANGSGAVGGGAAAGGDKQALLANEKRRRRRESHNAVERRRRDNINEKISELATLIPECMLDASGPPNAKDTGTSTTPPITQESLVPHGPIPPPPSSSSNSNSNSHPPPPSSSPDADTPLKKELGENEENVLLSTGGGGVNGGGGGANGAGAGEGGVVKANKGMILRKSVEYIRYLQQLVTVQGARNRELERELRRYRGEAVPVGDEHEGAEAGMGMGMGMEVGGMGMDLGGMGMSMDAVGMMGMEAGRGGGAFGGAGGEDAVMDSAGVDAPSHSASQNQNQNQNQNQETPGPTTTKKVARRKSLTGHHRKTSAGGRLPSMPEEIEHEEVSQQQQGQHRDVDMEGSPSGSSEGGGGLLGVEEERGRTSERVGGGGGAGRTGEGW